MLRARTVTQLLEVLDLYRKNRRTGESIERALQDAIQTVAAKYGVTYQTIGDGCRRRLELPTIEHLHALLEKWDQGNDAQLARVLREHTEVVNHGLITEFFDGRGISASPPAKDATASPPRSKLDRRQLTVDLDASDLSRLETLAQITGSSPSLLAAKFIADTLGRL